MLKMPQQGDRILMFKQPWLDMVLSGRKVLEIRSRALTGSFYIGYKKNIYAKVVFGPPVHIKTESEWAELRPQHRVNGPMPYKKTYGLPIHFIERTRRIPFDHPRGAITIVKYR